MIIPNIKTTGIELTPEISNHIDTVLRAIEKKVRYEGSDEVRCDIEVGQTRDQHSIAWRAEMDLQINGVFYRSEGTGENIKTALDEVQEEITRSIRRDKRKQASLLRRGGAKLKEMLRFGRRK